MGQEPDTTSGYTEQLLRVEFLIVDHLDQDFCVTPRHVTWDGVSNQQEKQAYM